MKVGQNADKKNVLNELLELGMVLVAIDARALGVDVPNHLSVDPQLRLNLSWRFGRPMEVDAWGIQAELTFGGVPYPCKFPWDAIFLLVSHVNGESYLFPDHVPKELLHQAAGEHLDEVEAEAAAKPRAKRARPKLSLVQEANEPEASPDALGPTLSERMAQPSVAVAPAVPAPGSKQPRVAAAPDKDCALEAETPGQPGALSSESSHEAGPPPAPQKPARSRGHLRLIK